MTNPSQPTGMMLDEILEKYKRSFTGNPGIYKTKAETIAAIQALVEEALPVRKPLHDNLSVGGDPKHMNDNYLLGENNGYYKAIDDLRSRLMRAGLLKGEK